MTLSPNASSELFVLMMDVLVGIVGFALSTVWWKVSGRTLDRDAVIFMCKMWGGIVIFGMILVFVM